MHAYSVYGLGLRSEFPIPELLQDDSAAEDITVRRAPIALPDASVAIGPHARAEGEAQQPPTTAEEVGDSWAERRANGETLCVFAGVGRYVVQSGRDIAVDPDPSADFAAVRHLLVGPVLAHLLWQRDVFALHASVVGIGGRHVGFVGVSGEGKSTIAAALVAAGHRLVCDDVAALVQRDTHIEVLPGFPRIRLHPDSLRGIGEQPADHPLVHDQIDKRLKPVSSFATEPVTLDAVFVLATGDDFAIEPLAPGAAIVELLRHTYYAHQYAPLYGFAQHLGWAKRIAERTSVRRLTRPKDLARLPELVGFLEAHAQA